MKIIVDSNIVFSAILNTQSKIGQLIINGSKYFKFFTIGLLKEEILNHVDKIISITGFSDEQFNETFQLITKRITFVEDILLNDSDLQKAKYLVNEIDPDDILFVALTNHLSGNLWTGDKKLITGLRRKGYSKVLNTDELFEVYITNQIKLPRKNKR
ncbi:MAG: PIN domain-containing protein [Spirosomataceae bacterium]|jgi:predicted nucleic acid-binding protein